MDRTIGMTNPTFNDLEISIAFEVWPLSDSLASARTGRLSPPKLPPQGGRSREDLSRDGKRCLARPTVKATLREWVQS
jgi:hypothetical protein